MKVKSSVMLSAVVILWGSSFTLLKLGLEEVSPISLAFLRFLIAAPFFTAFAYFRGRKIFERSVLQDCKVLAILGLTGITLYHTFQNVGLQFTTVSNSSLIISANPIFIALLGHLYLKEEMTWKRVLGMVLAFSGIVLITGPLRLTFSPTGVVGDLLSLGAGLSWALHSVYGKRVLLKYGAEKITAFSMIFGTLFLFPILLVSEELVVPMSVSSWFLLLILGLLCSGMAYFLWYKALEEVSVTSAGVSLFFIPIVSVLFARSILQEPTDTYFIAGAFLVMLGVIITERI